MNYSLTEYLTEIQELTKKNYEILPTDCYRSYHYCNRSYRCFLRQMDKMVMEAFRCRICIFRTCYALYGSNQLSIIKLFSNANRISVEEMSHSGKSPIITVAPSFVTLSYAALQISLEKPGLITAINVHIVINVR